MHHLIAYYTFRRLWHLQVGQSREQAKTQFIKVIEEKNSTFEVLLNLSADASSDGEEDGGNCQPNTEKMDTDGEQSSQEIVQFSVDDIPSEFRSLMSPAFFPLTGDQAQVARAVFKADSNLCKLKNVWALLLEPKQI